MLYDFGKTHLALKRVQTLLRNFGTLTECMAQKKKNPKEDCHFNRGGMVSTVIGKPLAKNKNGLTCSLR